MPPPPSPPQQPQGGGGDNSLAALWITILFFVTAGIIWYVAHAYIVAFVFKIKLWQAEFISLFTNQIDSLVAQLSTSDTSGINFRQMIDFSTRVGEYVRYPVILVLSILATVLYFNNVTLRFRKTHSMKTLAEQEQKNWPQIKPVVQVDLIKEDIDKGPWAMGMTPMQFAKKYQLLQEEPTVITEPTLRRKVNPTVSIIRSKAKQLFTLQVGRYWEGVDQLNIHTKALFAIFAARIERDRDNANALVRQIADSVGEKNLNFAGADALIKKHINSKAVQKIINRHAFVLTVMASMLEAARNDGVIPSADFLWLKPIDRPLWYMLNCVGRQTPFVETSGAFAHWLAEKEFEQKIMVPMVDEAVTALELAIKDIIYKPDEEEPS